MGKFIEDLKRKRKNYKLLKEIDEIREIEYLKKNFPVDVMGILSKCYDSKEDYKFKEVLSFMEEADWLNCSNKFLNEFIEINPDLLRRYIHSLEKNEDFYGNKLEKSDAFAKLVAEEKRGDLIKYFKLEELSVPTLKLLLPLLKKEKEINEAINSKERIDRLLLLKEHLSKEEIYILLNCDSGYKERFEPLSEFMTSFIQENIDYLIDVVKEANDVPKRLVESEMFRDECLKRGLYDMAVKCLLSPNIMSDENLINAYCKELGIKYNDFCNRFKWIQDYSKGNENIFNTIIGTSLKDNIFNIKKDHYERFINDIRIQMDINKLSEKEIKIFSNILSIYDYKNYDIPHMIVNILENIKNYGTLIDSLNLEDLSESDLKLLVKVLQFPENNFNISNIDELKNYDSIMKEDFVKNYGKNDIKNNKDKLLRLMFNIDLKEAKKISYIYLNNYDEANSLLDSLKDSDLPKEIYNYLSLIDSIVKCENESELYILFSELSDNKVYDCEIPIESYIRSKYINLYSKSLYKLINENNYNKNIVKKVKFNDKNVQVYIPREKFNFLVHSLGREYIPTNTNCKSHWFKPQIKNHTLCCSYINETKLNAIFSPDSVILGFDSLEGSAILSSYKVDRKSRSPGVMRYDVTHQIGVSNMYTPSEILKHPKGLTNRVYNEIVLERRNWNNDKQLKRKPDYVIAFFNSINLEDSDLLENIFESELSFVTEQDKKEIFQTINYYEIKKILMKYNAILSKIAADEGCDYYDLVDKYTSKICDFVMYNLSLKTSNDLDIPLVVVEKSYYFEKLLNESTVYDEETKRQLLELYSHVNTIKKENLFDIIMNGEDVAELLETKKISY